MSNTQLEGAQTTSAGSSISKALAVETGPLGRTTGAIGRLGGIPSTATTLSVSCLNNHFKALAVHRGVVDGAWEAQLKDISDFGGFIREAVGQTGYSGQTVSLLL